MIVTVTANPAVDKRLVVAGFRTAATNRATVERVDIGGKGINVAQNLARLGCEVVATGLLGAGGMQDLAATLRAERVRPDFVRVAGEVRTNLKISDPVTGVETEINEAGPSVTGEPIEALTDKLRLLARRCAVMVFSGSLPPGVPDDLYARWIRIASAAGVKTILDTAGPALACGIAASPHVVKPNRLEAEELLRTPLQHQSEIVAAARRLLEYGAEAAVISLGAGGALGACRDGVWRATAPPIVPCSTVGAGDAMVAALAFALERSLPAVDALRLATALGSAAAASAAPVPDPDRVERLLSQVVIEPLETRGAATGLLPGPGT